jgi:hypothetical protein
MEPARYMENFREIVLQGNLFEFFWFLFLISEKKVGRGRREERGESREERGGERGEERRDREKYLREDVQLLIGTTEYKHSFYYP